MPVRGEGFKLKILHDGTPMASEGNMGRMKNSPAMTKEEAEALNKLFHDGQAEVVVFGEAWVNTEEEAANYIQYLILSVQ